MTERQKKRYERLVEEGKIDKANRKRERWERFTPEERKERRQEIALKVLEKGGDIAELLFDIARGNVIEVVEDLQEIFLDGKKEKEKE